MLGTELNSTRGGGRSLVKISEASYHIKMASNRSVRFEPISCEILSRLHKKTQIFII